MGSGVLLAALVVLWFVVLVPMVVTRGDTHAGAGVAHSGRTLQRRRPVDPVVHAETERVTIDRALLVSSGELKVDVHAVRRRTLAGLVALAVLALVGALAYRPWMWAPQVLLDVAVVGYLMVIRAAAQRERRGAAPPPGPAAPRPRTPAPAGRAPPAAGPVPHSGRAPVPRRPGRCRSGRPPSVPQPGPAPWSPPRPARSTP